MNSTTTSFFALPQRLSPKADPALIAADDNHFRAIDASVTGAVEDLGRRLDEARLAPGGAGQAALDRDLEIHRLTARLRTLGRYGADLCLGRIVHDDETEPIWIGRLGLTDADGTRLLVDWRSPAAEPFFGATHAQPMGLVSRRRYHWSRGRVTDYWDEVFTDEGLERTAALDDQSAFIASLGSSRSDRMRDVLGTIQADQDAIIRHGSKGALVVDGGPGTGKTVVALHRTAYLLYADPRLGHRKGGVLFIGPHEPYLRYVSDVLPSLGEEGVLTCTLKDLVPEGANSRIEADENVARLKASLELVAAIEPAVGLYEEPPTEGMSVETPWAEVWLSAEDWAVAFDAPAPGTPHNEARDEIWEELVSILLDKHQDAEADVPEDALGRALARNEDLTETFTRAWPILDPAELIGDLWSVPAYLRRCAPGLTIDEVRSLQRPTPDDWTVSDLPLLDAARHRLGDPEFSRKRRRQEAEGRAQRDEVEAVIDHLIAADDDREGLAMMLRHPDLRENLVDDTGRPPVDADRLAGQFAHVVVDEAQELTDAEWSMVLRRCPSRSLTIVGDRAQARHGFTESWTDRLSRIGLRHTEIATLAVNYRTPVEVMDEAAPVIREALPDANVPTSVREAGVPVRHGHVNNLGHVLTEWLSRHEDGIAAVIGSVDHLSSERVTLLTPELAKGLEFDLVIVVDPASFGGGIEGAVDRYVSMTRATQELVVLTPGA